MGPPIAEAAARSAWKTQYAHDELTEVHCPACGSADSRDVAPAFRLAVARCSGCGQVYTRTPLPDSQSHYAAGSGGIADTKYGPILRGDVPHPRAPNYVEHLETIEATQPVGTLLDVGSHAGFFLRVARERGWQVTGV